MRSWHKSFASMILVVFLAVFLGCASMPEEPEELPEIPTVELAAPAFGFQLQTQGVWIQPGESVVYCEVFYVDGDITDVYEVGKIEMKSAPWLHHMSVGFVSPEGLANLGDEVSPDHVNPWPLEIEVPTGPFECSWGVFEHVKSLLFGTQSPEDALEVPEGTAMLLRGGLYLLVEYHYTNPTTEPIPARPSANIHFVDEPAQHFLSNFFFAYNNIDVPPKTKRSFAARCFFPKDVMLWGVARHTHEFATGFHVWFDKGERDGEHVWSSYDVEDPFFVMPGEPLEMKAGTGFRFQCDYDNTQDTILVLGSELGQEMCILLGLVWGVDSKKNPMDGITCVGARADPEPMPAP